MIHTQKLINYSNIFYSMINDEPETKYQQRKNNLTTYNYQTEYKLRSEFVYKFSKYP